MKATTQFGHRHTHKGRILNSRGNNNAKKFTVVHDPAGLYSRGAVFSMLDIQLAIHDGIFVDGMSFDTSCGRLRIDRGVMVYAKNRAKYPITE